MTQPAPPFACERCGTPQWAGSLACPRCGALVYRRRLEQLTADALRLETVNPQAAAAVWRQSLDLLPPDSQQYHALYHRMAALAAGPFVAAPPPYGAPQTDAYEPTVEAEPPPRRAQRDDAWPVAVAKTGGSMLLSVLCYMLLGFGDTPGSNFLFAAGFAGLILVHELGHVAAMRHYKLSASPPIFIPFLGALINMRDQPRNAKEEAIVGIAGPVAGTVGALVVLAAFLLIGPAAGGAYQEVLLKLSYFGVLLNLFNLLPFPPLDGGRVTAALNPWFWLVGLLGLVGMLAVGQIFPIVFVLILAMGLPRILGTLGRRTRGAYYDISTRSSWAIGAVYIALAAGLVALKYVLPRPELFGG